MGEQNKDKLIDTIEGHEPCQTREAKWLCLNNIYNHFQRPSFYDIGGTYISDLAGFWFLYKTEQVSNLYQLHLFMCSRQVGTYNLSLCNSNEMAINERAGTIHLNSYFKEYRFHNVMKSNYNYLTTYSFSELDVEIMKDKKLYIALAFNTDVGRKLPPAMEDIKKSHDFKQLLSDPIGADFTMVSADGARFPVHKLLLAARSEVFKAMLKGDTAESINNIVTIDDVNKEDLGCLIQFIYTGTIKEVEETNWYNLLMLGDRYDIKGLKELSQHALIELLNNNNSNALETLIAADMYNSSILKYSTLKYIKNNIASLESSAFHEMRNTQLVQELFKFLAMKC